MAETAINKLESVLAGIRGYLTEQLAELDGELDAARRSVAELSAELTSRQASAEALASGRDLLLAKLGELESVATDSATAAEPAEAAPAETATAEPAAVAEAPAAPAVVAETVATEAAAPVPTPTELSESQRAVLTFLEATPGVHKVAEIAVGVLGADASTAAVQGIRRALAVLTRAGLATKSAQSGTAFYSAEAPAPAPAPAKSRKAAAKKTTAKKAPAKKPVAEKAVAKKAVAKKAAVKEAAAEPAVTEPAGAEQVVAEPAVAEKAVAKKATKTAKKAPAKRASGTAKATGSAKTAKAAVPAPRSEPKTDGSPAEPAVRADRTRIVATLIASAEPQSAGELSRAMMGEEWRPSDATNFRNVLKSLTAQGLVAEHREENNRARYSAAASA